MQRSSTIDHENLVGEGWGPARQMLWGRAQFVLWLTCMAGAWSCNESSGARGSAGNPSTAITVRQLASWDVTWDADSVLTTVVKWTSAGGRQPFAQPVDLAVTDDGEVLVLDAGLARVIRLGPSGSPVGEFGRAGEGPGEFGGGLTRVLLGPTGTIYVPNPSVRRLEEFGSDGTYMGSLAMPFGSGLPIGYAVFDSNRVYRAASTLGRDSAGRGLIEPVVHVSRLFRDSVEEVAQLTAGGAAQHGLYAALPTWAATRTGVVLGSTDRFQLQFYDSNFALSADWSTSQALSPIDNGESEVLANAAFSQVNAAQREQTVLALMQRVGFAEKYPPWSTIIIAENGDVWLNFPATAAEIRAGEVQDFSFDRTGSPRWLVYDRDGKRAAEVKVPVGFRLKQVVGRRLYGVGTAADGSPVVELVEVVVHW